MNSYVDHTSMRSCVQPDLEEIRFYSQQRRIGQDNTVFRSLFANLDGVSGRTEVAATRDAATETAAEVLRRVPSVSAADRVKAWAMVPAALEERDDAAASHLDISGMELFSEAERADFAYNVGQHVSVASVPSKIDDCLPGKSQPPFSLRVREVEKRFREQMSVHRGLTQAARQLETTHAAVRQLQAEHRTQSVLRAIQARQDAVWARVWPDGGPPPLPADPIAPTRVPLTAYGPSSLPQPIVKAAAVQSRAQPTFTEPSSAAASPTSTASPTSDLLKDILRTFSKPRDQRVGDGATTPRSVASSLSPAAGTTRHTPRSETARVAATAAAVTATVKAEEEERDDGLPRPPRFTVSGVEIRDPPRPPRPYRVVRYVEVHHGPSSEPPLTVEANLPPGSLRRALAAAGVSDVVTSPSTISEVFSENNAPHSELSSQEVSTAETGSAGSDDDGARSDTGSVEDAASEAYSSDTFEVEDEDSGAADSTRSASVPSSVSSSIASASVASMGSVEDDFDGGSSLSTSTVPTTEVSSDGGGSRGATRNKKDRKSQRHDESHTRVRSGANVDEVVAQFLRACDAVNAAAQRLLHSPLVRKGKSPGATSSPPSLTTTTTSTSATGLTACKDEREGPHTSTDAAGQRDSLERQLRNVRHLRRFRTHLIRHLERTEARRTAQRDATRLLRDAQTLSKARHAAQRRAPQKDGNGIDVAGVLKKMKAKEEGKRAGGSAVKARHPQRRQRHANTKGGDGEVSDEVATELSSVVLSESSFGIEEDIDDDGVGGDSDERISDEVVEDWEVDSAVETDVVSDSVSSIADDAAHSGREDSGYTTSSFIDDAHSGDHANSAVPTMQSSFLDLAGGGLDEIEEELADRLAELSSAALSSSSSVPSELEELIDLLPSSLIPSEIAEDTDKQHRGGSGASSVVTESAIPTEATDTSAEEVKQRRRRTYAAVRSGAGLRGADLGKEGSTDAAFSPVASNASSDADVDTSMASSIEESRTLLPNASGVLPSPSKAARPPLEGSHVEAESSAVRGKATGIASHSSSSDSNSSGSDDGDDDSTFTASSSSLDALTALEMDMALTAGRRATALRSAATVPLFAQLYDPLVPAADDVTKGVGIDAKEEEATATAATPALVIQNSENEEGRGDCKDVASRLTAPKPPSLHTSQPAATATAAAAAYATEDLVAQSAWKSRQLHLLRQLRSLPVYDDVAHPGDETVLHTAEGSHQTPVEAAMDAAEAAAQEEWAQHWSAVESLIHTRFASPRYEARITGTRRPRLPVVRLSTSGSPSADGASRSASAGELTVSSAV